MKKVVTLLAVVLLPIVASAYQEDLTNLTDQIGDKVASAVAKVDAQNQANTRQDKIERIKDILSDAKYRFESSSWAASGGTGGAGSSSNLLTRHHYYKVEEITQNLNAEGLDAFLKNDAEALSEVADYVTDHNYYIFHNDFETLLAIGVTPIEAAIRTKGDEYVKIDTEETEEGANVTITYQHCYLESFVGYMHGGTAAKSDSVTITVTATTEELNALKEEKKVSGYNNDEYWKEVGRGMESFINNK